MSAGALLYLRVTSLIGRVTSRVRRLRQPKYLFGTVVGAGYIYLVYFRPRRLPRHASGPGLLGTVVPMDTAAVFLELAALGLFLVLALNWAVPRRASLTFSEAEIAFLFPAPVSRRTLLHYRLLSSQLGVMFTALIFTIVFGRVRAYSGNPWLHAIGWWLILSTINLHFIGTTFVYSELMNRSMTSGRRRAITIGVVAAVVLALTVWAVSALRLPRPGDFNSVTGFLNYLVSQLHAGPLPWLLAIPKIVIAPYFATTASAFLPALGFALIVLLAHYFWVMYTQVSFEEASIARAEKRAARIQAARQGDWRGQATRRPQRAPFELGDSGRPEVAFLWKNLFPTGVLARPRTVSAVVIVIVAGGEWLASHPELEPIRAFLTFFSGAALAVTLFLGSMLSRQDLRADLPNIDILKIYPLRGRQVVLGELLAPLTNLSVAIWLLLLIEFLLAPEVKFTWFDSAMRSAATLAAAVIAPPFVAIQLLVLNGAVLLFPAWTQAAGNRADRGIERIGQGIIFIAGLLLVTAIALIPAATSAALIFLVAKWLAGPLVAMILAAAAVFLLLSIETWLGIHWLGGRFERFDLSAELRP
jgi:ABC-2 type transport system permease protein